MTTSKGVRAVAGAADAAEAAASAAEGRQLSLIPGVEETSPRARGEGELELEPITRFEPGTLEHTAMMDQVRRARGRPLGSRNVANARKIAQIIKMCGDPFLRSARMAQHTPATLARELGCTQLEAAQFLESILRDLRTYCYSKLAPTDGAGNAVVPSFTVQIGAHQAGPQALPWVYPGGPELNGTDLSSVGQGGETPEKPGE